MSVFIDDADAPHIFRDAPGHVADTAEARAMLIALVARDENLVGEDRYGTLWYARMLDDGGQAWAQVRGGRIRNGGVNRPPRDYFSVATGFSRTGPSREGR